MCKHVNIFGGESEVVLLDHKSISTWIEVEYLIVLVEASDHDLQIF